MTRRIDDHAFLGDGRCGALVARDGAVDWMAAPRLDRPPFFAALLGEDRHGVWRLSPIGSHRCRERRYAGDGLVLETVFEAEGGAIRIVDFMAIDAPRPHLVRIVEGLRGAVPVCSEIVPRFEFGTFAPRAELLSDGSARCFGGADALLVRASVPLVADAGVVSARFAVRAGERAWFTLAWFAPPADAPPAALDPYAARVRVDQDATCWTASLELPAFARSSAKRAASLLRRLVYAPTGAVWAAATTSLPEKIGGTLNWDYRYAWVRDTAFAIWALLELGALDEAAAGVAWLLRTCAGRGSEIQPFYAVDGTRRVPETVVSALPGYCGSLPVRDGNAAALQHQMDVFGEILLSAVLVEERGRRLDASQWAVVVAIADALHELWRRPGHGFWEERGDAETFLAERTLTCVGLRAVARAAAERGNDDQRLRYDDLARLAEESIYATFVDRRRTTFVSADKDRAVGGTSLWPILMGIVPGDDPLARGTVRAVERDLVRGGLVYRSERDLRRFRRPREGAFLPCTSWLARAQAICGDVASAEATFRRFLATANDVGLFSEEYDVDERHMLGNLPQAFTLAEVILGAHALAKAGAADPPASDGKVVTCEAAPSKTAIR